MEKKESHPNNTMDKSTENIDEKMKKSALHKFFISALKDIYYAEHALIDSLEKMQKFATTEELKDAFEDHQLQTKKHISRLDKIFGLLDEKTEKKECEAIKGLIKEAEEMIKSTQDGSMTRDAALIIAAQKIEHYEIATYGGLVQLAITMEHHKVAELLEKTLVEEEETDDDLTDIAETLINFEAEAEEN
ncbi:ferritin-like domain-containing protein [Empedobacter stercoris]|uniref:Ferritin-like domain-containing protein n=1 Tax=Empedobacter stercoris TaxID=1628248 RepID=A0ABX1WJJ7_9FLAO|nr:MULTISPECIES: ferritin-like domain-containing protein [Empedobacter]HJD86521.1 ferritin-like domain-containing protein [Empedobacter falsenii]MCA4809789.1 ferritin-like domain-containing protein [Empedobacter stercoris]MDM1543527.1 ferritin-like domain-containing protein [Empedobacter sp. 189-2]NOJ74858.1 ferritin-like domain-containing protein [Empedobacter stercoris]QNT13916.1 ferritin-like domain-containing protein [Empedobacter stercoris]